MNKHNKWFKGSRDRGLTYLKYKIKILNEKNPKIVPINKLINEDEIAS